MADSMRDDTRGSAMHPMAPRGRIGMTRWGGVLLAGSILTPVGGGEKQKEKDIFNLPAQKAAGDDYLSFMHQNLQTLEQGLSCRT